MTPADKAIVEYGDFQTPISFASKVCQKLSAFYRLQPDIVIEPTFGAGNFFDGILAAFPRVRTLYGIEINKDYYKEALNSMEQNRTNLFGIELYNADIFSFDFSDIKESVSNEDALLIIGNPPWATNSQLTALGSANLPLKSNFKGCSGFEAVTGKGNFDIAEYIVLQLLNEFANHNCTLAMLCKTIVAKNILRDIDKFAFSISSMNMFLFDANEVFGVNCDAGLLVVCLGKPATEVCAVYDFDSEKKIREFGWLQGAFYASIQDNNKRSDIDGKCQFEWRQGVKHDCSRVMELKAVDSDFFQNGLGEVCSFQLGKYIYPLIKSSDIKAYEINDTRKYVIVPQKRVKEDTSQIQDHDSALWEYLQRHDDYLSARQSVIYRNSPKYSIFGIGDYSFTKYKVGMSGFYKEPRFALIKGDIPVMLDDTCYFLSFDDIETAVITLALLNSPECLTFLKSIAFLDSKRPYTKDILRRIDLEKLSKIVSFDYICSFADALPSDYYLTEPDYYNYQSSLLT